MFRLIKYLLSFALIITLVTAASVYYLASALPPAQTLKQITFQVPLRILSADGLLIAEFGEKRRIPVEYNAIPEPIIHAFLAAEDDRFFEHPGIDYQGLLRAIYTLVTTGEKTQGGSTITMQVARNFFLSNEKTYLRKLNEIILAVRIEQLLTKKEILTLYLNKIYLGKRAYGIAAAAKVYYGKPLQALTLAEIAMIAGLPKAPSRFNPLVNPDRAKIRRDYVLRRMWETGHISQGDYKTARKVPLTAHYHARKIEVYAPFVAEMVRNQLVEQYGEEVYSQGVNVYTTIRSSHQVAANQALQSALFAYDRRHGYRGILAHKTLTSISQDELQKALSQQKQIGPLKPALVLKVAQQNAIIYTQDHGLSELSLESISWARKKISVNKRGAKITKVTDVLKRGDIIYVMQDKQGKWQLSQLPEIEGALIAVSPFNGAVTALKGGFDYFNSKFNRVTQSRRQPGSGFKPFIYSSALEKGYTAASIVNDAPIVFNDGSLGNIWRPENYSGKFFGPTRLRVALAKSRNLVSIRLLRDITAGYARRYVARFGFNFEQMPRNLSLALGSGSASPWDMARAYSALANGGYRIEPYVIQRIEDANGEIVMQAQPHTVCETCTSSEADHVDTDNQDAIKRYGLLPAKRIMTPQNNYIMNSLLRDVIQHGTGRSALKLGRQDLAGKTGTTNDQVDAWFNGFHPELVAISWAGFDSPQTLGRSETGGKVALPMWISFMKVVLDGLPEEPLTPPIGMVTAPIDSSTGLLAHSDTEQAIYETFRKQYLPTDLAPTKMPKAEDTSDDARGDYDEVELF